MGIELKVSEKGCVSVYGLRRFPISLYPDEWQRILDEADAIRDFIAENHNRLSYKDSPDSIADIPAAADSRTFSQRMGWKR